MTANRNAPVKCDECGRTVPRRGRRQKFCSDRCRGIAKQRAYRDRQALAGEPQNAQTVTPGMVTPAALPISAKLPNENNDLQGAKTVSSSRYSVPLDIIGGQAGFSWGAPPLDTELRDSIINAEVKVTDLACDKTTGDT